MNRVEKPWGHELIWADTEHYAGKILVVLEGRSTSLQYHEHKHETLCVLDGRVSLELDGKTMDLAPGDMVDVKPLSVHRLTATEDARVLEASTAHLGDVVRVEDDYGREGSSA